jgi:predicted HTH domain antitoxin
MQVTLQLPDEIARGIGVEADLPRRVKEAVALEGYRAGRFSQGQVGLLLGQSFSETETFLKENNAILQYSKADLKADLAALDRVLATR